MSMGSFQTASMSQQNDFLNSQQSQGWSGHLGQYQQQNPNLPPPIDDRYMNFLVQSKGKKIRWSDWDKDTFFIAEYVDSKGFVFGNTFRSNHLTKPSNYFIAGGFLHGNPKWEFVTTDPAWVSGKDKETQKKPFFGVDRTAKAERFNEKEKKPMFTEVKDYFREHKTIIVSVALVIALDHFVFKGAFREKIKALVDRFLDRAHQKVDQLTDNSKAA